MDHKLIFRCQITGFFPLFFFKICHCKYKPLILKTSFTRQKMHYGFHWWVSMKLCQQDTRRISISRVDFIHDAHTKQNTPKQNPKTALHVHKMLQDSNVENWHQHHSADETIPANMKETDFLKKDSNMFAKQQRESVQFHTVTHAVLCTNNLTRL